MNLEVQMMSGTMIRLQMCKYSFSDPEKEQTGSFYGDQVSSPWASRYLEAGIQLWVPAHTLHDASRRLLM